jgi:aryl-alcohol dehydrogenase-like predicted oxidoreductase
MLPTQQFGSTGHASSRAIFGAAALGSMSPERAATTLEVVVRHGVNHIDTAASYGESELRLQPWLDTHRHQVFLATKTGDRDAVGARASLERSLDRMAVGHVDLIQLHNLVEEDEWAKALGRGGALEALVQARQEGLCRYIGVTGHGTRIPRMHLRSLAEYPFDSVLFPYNYAMMTSPTLTGEGCLYRDDVEELLATCAERGVAVQTIKSVARRRWPERGPGQRSWYEPIEDEAAIDRAVKFVLGRPGLFLNTSSDANLLPAILTAATHPAEIPTEEAMEADRVALGITALFDGADLERI